MKIRPEVQPEVQPEVPNILFISIADWLLGVVVSTPVGISKPSKLLVSRSGKAGVLLDCDWPVGLLTAGLVAGCPGGSAPPGGSPPAPLVVGGAVELNEEGLISPNEDGLKSLTLKNISSFRKS